MLEDVVLPIAIVGMSMMVPIVVVLLKHQQKMAELYREERLSQAVQPRLVSENESLKKELADMKAMLYEQAIAIDNLKPRAMDSEIAQRVEGSRSQP